MDTLHKSSIQATDNFGPKEGQRGLLCSNKRSLRCPSLGYEQKGPTLLTVERYRQLTGDTISPEEQVIRRLQFLDSLCRNIIKDEIQKYEQSQKTIYER